MAYEFMSGSNPHAPPFLGGQHVKTQRVSSGVGTSCKGSDNRDHRYAYRNRRYDYRLSEVNSYRTLLGTVSLSV